MPPKERSIRAEGVILRHTDFGEADRLLTIFTRELGKVRVIAKGVRKARSRKAGHVEPFTHSQLQLARGRDLLILTQAETAEGYAALRENLILLGYASYVIELLATRYYELRLLDYVGFRPHLFHCAQCEAEIQATDQYFSATRGGVLCPGCGSREAEARPISILALKYLRHLQRSSYQDAARATIPATVSQEMENLMQYYLTHTLERGLNSPAFLRRVRREQSGRESPDS